MKKVFLIVAVTLCAALCAACGNQGDSLPSDAQNATESGSDGSGSASEDNSYNGWLPDVGLGEITQSELIPCFVSEKKSLDYAAVYGRVLYLITVQAEDGSTLRFQTNQTYYDSVQLNQELNILHCEVKPVFGSTEQRYYLKTEQLYHVMITSNSPEQQVSPSVGEYATLIGETVQSFTVVNAEYDRDFVGLAGKGGHWVDYYYVFLENQNGETICVNDEDLFNIYVIGDTLDILVQTIEYPISGKQLRYCYRGEVLNTT